MRRYRITIAGLGGFVVLVALGLAALRNASAWWAAGVESAALLLLGVATVGAWRGGRSWRAFWAGALVFGGGYGALSLVGPEPEPEASASKPGFLKGAPRPEPILEGAGPRFLIDALLARLIPVLYPPATVYTVSYGGRDLATIYNDAEAAREYERQIGRAAAERPSPRSMLVRGQDGRLLHVFDDPRTAPPIQGPVALLPIDLSRYAPDALDIATTTDPTPTPAYRSSFLRAGHALFAVLAGLIGGIATDLAVGPRRSGRDRPA